MGLEIDLMGKKGLIFGVRNSQSIAYGCARILRSAGAELGLTYRTEEIGESLHNLAESLSVSFLKRCDVQNEDQCRDVFEVLSHTWGELDFVIHSIAFAPQHDLHGPVRECSRDGFLRAMDISCYSFLRLAHYAVPLMKRGGSLLTVSYIGSEHVVPHYGIMGPVKAALESAVHYLAAELGENNIRVNALSPGPIKTSAASGIVGFDDLLKMTALKSPMHRNIDLDDVGHMAAFLVSNLAKNVTGSVHSIDAGYACMSEPYSRDDEDLIEDL
jgi:enoyl-[acyl-carrier protein] reductase I